jgi:DNA-binding MarR family transcriptional regulator
MSGSPGKGEGPVPPSSDRAIRSLNDQLGSSSLKSSSRILILILLVMNKKLTATALRALTGLQRGSLQNHLEKLEAAGYVKTKNVKSFDGWRQTVEITQEGLDRCRELLRTINTLDV